MIKFTATYMHALKVKKAVDTQSDLTLEQHCLMLKKSMPWLQQQLQIAKLHHVVGKMYDDGLINIKKVILLTDCTPLEQLYFRDDAAKMKLEAFIKRINNFREWVAVNKDSDGKIPMEGRINAND